MNESSLQTQMNNLRLGHAENRKDLEYVKETMGRIEGKLDSFIKGADKKYAPYFAWVVVKWGGAVVGATILGALMSLILLK